MSCDCRQTGLSGVTGRPVHLGAPFQLGVEFSDWWLDTSFKDLSQILIEIESALAASGYTAGQVKAYQLAGYINPFVVIESYSGREYGSDAHLKDSVLSVVSKIYPQINYGTVTFQVETYDPSTGQTQTIFQPSPIAAAGTSPGVGSAVDSIGQSLGSVFNVDATTGLVIGAVGAVALILLLKRL